SASMTSARDVTPDPAPIIPAQPLAAALASLPGTLDGIDDAAHSRGSGNGPGAGDGDGGGMGPGRGDGLGDGLNKGMMGGPFRAGAGVTRPVPIFEARPQYTADAMRARVQGSVFVQCVVQITGQCSDLRVVRSLDRTFGLDAEAIKAAQRWRFKA